MKNQFLMMICAGLLLQPASAAVVLVTSAAALRPTDSINWSVLGPAGSTFANPTSSFTGAGKGFTVSKELAGNFQRVDAAGNVLFFPGGMIMHGFDTGAPLIRIDSDRSQIDELSIVFDEPVFGAGANIVPGELFGNPGRVRAFGSSNNLLGEATIPNVSTGNPLSVQFIGLLSDSPDIKRISFAVMGVPNSQPGHYMLGNVSINAVPEPSTYALLGASLLGLGLLRRKR